MLVAASLSRERKRGPASLRSRTRDTRFPSPRRTDDSTSRTRSNGNRSRPGSKRRSTSHVSTDTIKREVPTPSVRRTSPTLSDDGLHAIVSDYQRLQVRSRSPSRKTVSKSRDRLSTTSISIRRSCGRRNEEECFLEWEHRLRSIPNTDLVSQKQFWLEVPLTVRDRLWNWFTKIKAFEQSASSGTPAEETRESKNPLIVPSLTMTTPLESDRWSVAEWEHYLEGLDTDTLRRLEPEELGSNLSEVQRRQLIKWIEGQVARRTYKREEEVFEAIITAANNPLRFDKDALSSTITPSSSSLVHPPFVLPAFVQCSIGQAKLDIIMESLFTASRAKHLRESLYFPVVEAAQKQGIAKENVPCLFLSALLHLEVEERVIRVLGAGTGGLVLLVQVGGGTSRGDPTKFALKVTHQSPIRAMRDKSSSKDSELDWKDERPSESRGFDTEWKLHRVFAKAGLGPRVLSPIQQIRVSRLLVLETYRMSAVDAIIESWLLDPHPLHDIDAVNAQFARIISGIQALLADMKTRHWTHGDLHSGNIAYRQDGRIFLIDFGYADISQQPFDNGGSLQILDLVQLYRSVYLLQERWNDRATVVDRTATWMDIQPDESVEETREKLQDFDKWQLRNTTVTRLLRSWHDIWAATLRSQYPRSVAVYRRFVKKRFPAARNRAWYDMSRLQELMEALSIFFSALRQIYQMPWEVSEPRPYLDSDIASYLELLLYKFKINLP